MKQTTIAASIGAVLASAAFLTVPSLAPQQAHAAEVAGNEQYRMFPLRSYGDDVARLEADLNKLAAEGWKVRTGVGVALVLAK